ncbi:MAG: hypothetical protein MMC23_003672 [Stictis urceolatum]|nr:hypothetical protein [Stictis urceolata]
MPFPNLTETSPGRLFLASSDSNMSRQDLFRDFPELNGRRSLESYSGATLLSEPRLWRPTHGIHFSQGQTSRTRQGEDPSHRAQFIYSSRCFSSTPSSPTRREPVLFWDNPAPERIPKASLREILNGPKEDQRGRARKRERAPASEPSSVSRAPTLKRRSSNTQALPITANAGIVSRTDSSGKVRQPGSVVQQQVAASGSKSSNGKVRDGLVAPSAPASNGPGFDKHSLPHSTSHHLQKRIDELLQDTAHTHESVRLNYDTLDHVEMQSIGHLIRERKHEPSLMERASIELQIHEPVGRSENRAEEQWRPVESGNDFNLRYYQLLVLLSNLQNALYKLAELIQRLRTDEDFTNRHAMLLKTIATDSKDFATGIASLAHSFRMYHRLLNDMKYKAESGGKQEVVAQLRIQEQLLRAPFNEAKEGISRVCGIFNAFLELRSITSKATGNDAHIQLCRIDKHCRAFSALQLDFIHDWESRNSPLPRKINDFNSTQVALRNCYRTNSGLLSKLGEYVIDSTIGSAIKGDLLAYRHKLGQPWRDITAARLDEFLLSAALEHHGRKQVMLKANETSSPGPSSEKNTRITYSFSVEAAKPERKHFSDDTQISPWSFKFYLNEKGEPPAVQTCNTLSSANGAVARFFGEQAIGLDLEWMMNARPLDGIKKNVSLIQIASESQIVLIHLSRFKGSTVSEHLPPNLKTLLENPNIMKTGVAIEGDCTRLQRTLGIQTKGMMELSHLYKLVKYSSGGPDDIRSINKRLVSLATQVEEHLGMPLKKDDHVRGGRWDLPLGAEQTEYAASDAYASHRLFLVLDEKRRALNPVPPLPKCAEEKHAIMLASGQTVAEYCVEHELKTTATVAEPIEEESEDESTMARDFMAMTTGEPAPSVSAKTVSQPRAGRKRTSRTRNKSPSTLSPPNVDVVEAEEWAGATRARITARQGSSMLTKVLPSHLKAYYLWRHRDMEVGEIAELLRDVPLKVATVASYIVQAVKLGKLPFDKEKFEEVEEVAPKFGYRYGSGKS